MPLFRRTDDREWRAVELVALDFETTTADPRKAEPLSVGWVAVRDGRVQVGRAGYELVAHDRDVPVASMPIHGLLPGELQRGLDVADVAVRLRAALTDRLAVAHGAWIERALLDRLDVDHAGLVDTLAIVRRLDERDGRATDDVTLPAVARRFGVPLARAHHAFGDALTTATLLVTLAGRIEHARGRCTVDDLLRLGGR